MPALRFKNFRDELPVGTWRYFAGLINRLGNKRGILSPSLQCYFPYSLDLTLTLLQDDNEVIMTPT
jgi:hypothetical protein